MNPRGSRNSIPLGAKDGEKYPKEAKGGRKFATTFFF